MNKESSIASERKGWKQGDLEWQVPASRVHQIHTRKVVLCCNLLCAKMLARCKGIVSSTLRRGVKQPGSLWKNVCVQHLDNRIVRHNHAYGVGNATDARDDARTRNRLVVHFMCCRQYRGRELAKDYRGRICG